jgi:actin related protein 2/3 complex subunit 1A/1B
MDRNVYVWSPAKDWKPTLVALNFSKAVTCVSWSAGGNKFGAGGADGSIAVAYYDADNDWWIGKLSKQPLKNTITALTWHPNALQLVAACVDGRVLSCSGFVKAVDGKEGEEKETLTE